MGDFGYDVPRAAERRFRDAIRRGSISGTGADSGAGWFNAGGNTGPFDPRARQAAGVRQPDVLPADEPGQPRPEGRLRVPERQGDQYGQRHVGPGALPGSATAPINQVRITDFGTPSTFGSDWTQASDYNRRNALYIQDRFSLQPPHADRRRALRLPASVLQRGEARAAPDRRLRERHDARREPHHAQHGGAARRRQLRSDGRLEVGGQGVLRPVLLQLRRPPRGRRSRRRELQGLRVPRSERQPPLRRHLGARHARRLVRRHVDDDRPEPEDAVHRRDRRLVRSSVLGRVVGARRLRAQDVAQRLRDHQRRAHRPVHRRDAGERDAAQLRRRRGGHPGLHAERHPDLAEGRRPQRDHEHPGDGGDSNYDTLSFAFNKRFGKGCS